MSLCHMHHCMSMNVLEKGASGLVAGKASDIDDFVCRKTTNPLCHLFCVVCPSEGWRRVGCARCAITELSRDKQCCR